MIMTKAGEIHCVIELKNCEFFASLNDQILPLSNSDIKLTVESDDVLLYRKIGLVLAKLKLKIYGYATIN